METAGGPVAEDVRRRILSMLAQGSLSPGARLGTEREMAERFGVSRATLRSALLPLSGSGVLERRTGRAGGTFIRSDIFERDAEMGSLPSMLAASGRTSSSRVLATELRPASVTEAAALEIDEGDHLVVVKRLRAADDSPLSIDLARFPAALVPGLLDHPLGGSLYELLRDSYGLVAARIDETIEVAMASVRESQWLEIPRRRPLFAITRVGREATGRPFEYSYDLFRSDRTRLRSHSTVAPNELTRDDGTVERFSG